MRPTTIVHAGYALALREAGIAYDPALVIAANSEDTDYGWRSFDAFQALDAPPTAILFFTDPLAIQALSHARARGIRVPQDLSIAGYDGILSSGVTEPALTTVRQSTSEMGVLAVESLFKLITDGNAEPQQHILPVELIVRDSTAINIREPV